MLEIYYKTKNFNFVVFFNVIFDNTLIFSLI